jgi:UDP-2,3-diacylglucosamine pyrophosphatase LpxH
MLVIISDIHLTDPSSGKTVKEGAFRVFRDTLRDLAYDASWTPDKKYQPIKELHLLLLGDILDVIRSRTWLDKGPKPWHDSSNPEFIDRVSKITDDILQKNERSLNVLRDLDVGGDVTIPPAEGDKPKNVAWEPSTQGRHRVKVHRHYMVGNHDWFYHLKGPGYDKIRATIVKALGLENAPDKPFPWEPSESECIQKFSKAHRVFARHGDLYDHENFNPERGRDGSSIGDAIVVELINRFHADAADQLQDQLSDECIQGLNELDNVRPQAMAVVWLAGLLKRTCKSRHQRDSVKQIWNKTVENFLSDRFVRSEPSGTKLIWRISRWLPLETLSSALVSWPFNKLINLRGAQPNFHNAIGEQPFANQTAEFFVYGHTHNYELVPLVSTESGKEGFKQIYINSGTWRPYHELAMAKPQEHEFVSYELMTMLAFYEEGERRGRSFEVWNGTLSPGPEND